MKPTNPATRAGHADALLGRAPNERYSKSPSEQIQKLYNAAYKRGLAEREKQGIDLKMPAYRH